MQWTTTQDQFAEVLSSAIAALAADEDAVCAVLESQGKAIVLRKAVGCDEATVLGSLDRGDLARQYGIDETRLAACMRYGGLTRAGAYEKDAPPLIHIVGDGNMDVSEARYIMEPSQAHDVASRYSAALHQAKSERFTVIFTRYQ